MTTMTTSARFETSVKVDLSRVVLQEVRTSAQEAQRTINKFNARSLRIAAER